MFEIGDRVSLRRDTSVRGVVLNKVETGAEVIYTVQLDHGALSPFEYSELTKEVSHGNPWENLIHDSFQENQVFGVSNTIHKVANNLGNTISALKASKTMFMPYQYKPLLKFLQSDTKRILVADEVGLGKTIEAGHIILELLVRGNLSNALIICKNSLKEKWKSELKNKFNLDFISFDKGRDLKQVIEQDANNGSKTARIISNYEALRTKSFVELIETTGYGFDLVVMDEAQFIRNQSTQTFKAIEKILDYSNSVVMLTATPIMTEVGNLHSLLKLLDPSFEERVDFDQAINQNRPFVKALNQVNNRVQFEEIKDGLLNEEIFVGRKFGEEEVGRWETVADQMKDDPLFEILLQKLEGSWTPEKASEIQRILQEFNRFHSIYTRTRKRDVQNAEDRAIRRPHKIQVQFTDEEMDLYLSEIQRQEAADANVLSIISRKRMMSSCWPVYARKYKIAHSPSVDSKFDALREVIKNVVDEQDKKIIIFSFFTETLEYLNEELSNLGYQTAVIHGKRSNRQDEIDRFTNDPKCKIFLSSEVGSEGLDLQFCDSLVNYNLPWNPMVVEQRIGRIDRVGQESSILHIYNLVIAGTIEEKIYNRLLDRIGIFRAALGDLEAILDDKSIRTWQDLSNLESDIYTQNLSEDEINEKIDQAAVAIEVEKRNLADLETNLDQSFANDSYMQQEIEKINSNKQYITSEELIGLLKFLFSYKEGGLPQFRFVENEDHYSLEWYRGDTLELIDFIRDNISAQEKHPDLHFMKAQFERKIRNETSVKLTFDPEVSRKNKDYEFVSTYHPLVNGAMNFFVKERLDRNLTFKYQIKTDTDTVEEGIYLLGLINNQINKILPSGKPSQLVVQDYFSVALDEQLNVQEKAVTEHLLSLSQLGNLGRYESPSSFSEVPEELKNELFSRINVELYNSRKAVKNQSEPAFISNLERSIRSQKEMLKFQVDRIQSRIDNDPENKIVKVWLTELQSAKDRIARLDSIHAKAINSFEVDADLVTLCLIEVIKI